MNTAKNPMLDDFRELQRQLVDVSDVVLKNFQHKWNNFSQTTFSVAEEPISRFKKPVTIKKAPNAYELLRIQACENRYYKALETAKVQNCPKEEILAHFEQNVGIFLDLREQHALTTEEKPKKDIFTQMCKLTELYFKVGFTAYDSQFGVPMLPGGLSYLD